MAVSKDVAIFFCQFNQSCSDGFGRFCSDMFGCVRFVSETSENQYFRRIFLFLFQENSITFAPEIKKTGAKEHSSKYHNILKE